MHVLVGPAIEFTEVAAENIEEFAVPFRIGVDHGGDLAPELHLRVPDHDLPDLRQRFLMIDPEPLVALDHERALLFGRRVVVLREDHRDVVRQSAGAEERNPLPEALRPSARPPPPASGSASSLAGAGNAN